MSYAFVDPLKNEKVKNVTLVLTGSLQDGCREKLYSLESHHHYKKELHYSMNAIGIQKQ